MRARGWLRALAEAPCRTAVSGDEGSGWAVTDAYVQQDACNWHRLRARGRCTLLALVTPGSRVTWGVPPFLQPHKSSRPLARISDALCTSVA
jgi:hypothetical protein